MPNPGGFGELGFEQAALAVEVALRTKVDAHWRRLAPDELTSAYFTRRFARGWRIDMMFSDGMVRAIDLLVGAWFPAGYPRTALVDGPGQLVWPHVEHDGVLCLLPVIAEVDAEQPGEVAVHLLARSARLIEELIEGSIIDRDFREEFLTYWAYAADKRVEVHSLVEPRGPSRAVSVWRDEGSVVVGENKAALDLWLDARFGRRPGRKTRKIEPAVLLWLSEPPLPSQYPEVGVDLVSLAHAAGDGAVELLADVAGRLPHDVTALIGAEGRGGPGLVAAITTAHLKASNRHGRVESPLTKGFQPTAMPELVAVMRTYSSAPVIKANVKRADAPWIHGRGKDARTTTFLKQTATVIGCGSVGASVATRLAHAGVGILHLVDYEDFSWSNLGRHELGAASVGQNKALELAARLKADFPHLKIVGHATAAQSLINGHEDLLTDSDILIATTGSWDAEGALNRWHIANGRKIPIVYGWTESHAAAGHAVTIGAEGGCLRCGMGATGHPVFEATEREDGAMVEEPSCGNHFSPYGAVELSFVVDLVARAALRAMLNPPLVSEHAIWLEPIEDLEASGGHWSTALEQEFPNAVLGGQLLARLWPKGCCRACGANGATPAA